MVAGAAVVAPAAGVAVLGAAGFGAGGVTPGRIAVCVQICIRYRLTLLTMPGSIAAGAQSVIYGAFTMGVFSTLQAAGATAVAPAIGPVIAGIGAMAGGAAVVAKNVRL